ncbi:choline/ethanolaminephosphotransferase, putative [Plasmodium relictum]|uniref:Choline/ethanolaminephosphotransferase, putative n=1 Tax=Plasmodium relictum TaxID=85471 RepID=A0A1J1H8H3_PLARL|nr:choline/ethanolaminephosphotransferase, putative [Plasmodium relictum]CRH00854.1 choline/ethanolaminephosphotransferase, putative [Plasmodium relictum]
MGIFLKLNKNVYSNCKSYVYKSSGSSILDNIFNVYWSICVNFVPKSITANLLTLLGFLCSTIAFFLMYLFDPLEEKHDYIFIYIGLFLFLYQTFDAIDGKQARRTNTSSPLGQLFDHGCDSITSSLFIFIVGKVADLPKGLVYYILLSSIHLQTYLFSWIEYHTRVYNTSFGKFGITEAHVLVISMCIIRGIKGVGIFNTVVNDIIPDNIRIYLSEYVLGLKLNYLILIPASFFILLTISRSIYMGLQHAKKIREALSQLAIFYIYVFMQYYFYQSSLTDKHELICLLIISLYSSVYTLHMNLSSVLKIQMELFPSPIIFYYISIVVLFLKHSTSHQFLNTFIFKDIYILYCMLIFIIIYLIDYANTIITNVCKELNINFLFNKKRKTK